MVIEWSKKKATPKNSNLEPIYVEVNIIACMLLDITFHHIYREKNMSTETLSKQGLQLVEGTWKKWEGLYENIKELTLEP